ncbi:MAG: family 43 glycosylhydrolase [Bacteroides sp.]|nr:family 43 glycosylhydrolase [Bacteroides sp.]
MKNLNLRLLALLCGIFCSIALFPLTACGGGNDEIPGVVEPDEPDTPDTPDTPDEPDGPTQPIVPTGPYQYDHDMTYDAEAFLKAYKGTPYKGPHQVPGTLEAEDFDEGAANMAYYERDSKGAEAGYRGSHDVDVRGDGGASGGYYIGDVQPEEWMCYTIDVTEAGCYAIETWIVKGDGSEGYFYFEVDGRGVTRSIEMPQGGWTDFTKKVTAEGIQLTKGTHVLKYYASTPGNVDKFVLTRTGEWQDPATSISYPVTKAMKNPLFVDFESPMFNSWVKGPLYTADASAHVWNINGKEVLYVYASHDMEPAVGCDRMDRYHVFSTEDMVNWTDHGEILNAATVRLHAGWGVDGFMWAPDCAYNPENETYYFYFPHPTDPNNRDKTWRVGIAVSKYPDKEFTVVGYVEGMPSKIDPCVFIDDDGQPYIYNGGGGECYGAKLKKNDWTKLDGEVKRMTGLHDFHEATWIHKYNGKYYLSHSDNNSPDNGGNNMRYAVSDSPLGPWKDLGIYMKPTGVETNHGSIVKYKGEWYAFYHTGDYSGQGNLRSVCVDKLTVNADGTLEIVQQTRDENKIK